DVRVLEPGRGPRLLEEALDLLRRIGARGPEPLQRNGALELPIVGPHDLAHPAGPQERPQAVLAGNEPARSVRPPVEEEAVAGEEPRIDAVEPAQPGGEARRSGGFSSRGALAAAHRRSRP